MKNLLKLFVFFLYVFVCLYSVAFAEQKVVVTEGKYVLTYKYPLPYTPHK